MDAKEELVGYISAMDSNKFAKEWTFDNKFNSNCFFFSLNNAKYNLKLNIDLGLYKLFTKDYKLFEYNGFKVGYSTICLSL